jgi:hypothetical protein
VAGKCAANPVIFAWSKALAIVPPKEKLLPLNVMPSDSPCTFARSRPFAAPGKTFNGY